MNILRAIVFVKRLTCPENSARFYPLDFSLCKILKKASNFFKKLSETSKLLCTILWKIFYQYPWISSRLPTFMLKTWNSLLFIFFMYAVLVLS